MESYGAYVDPDDPLAMRLVDAGVKGGSFLKAQDAKPTFVLVSGVIFLFFLFFLHVYLFIFKNHFSFSYSFFEIPLFSLEIRI